MITAHARYMYYYYAYMFTGRSRRAWGVLTRS